MQATTEGLSIAAASAAQNCLTATSVESIANLRDCVVEPKADGWRLLAHVHDNGVDLYSRTGKSYTGRMPHVEAELLDRFPAGTWLDGEAVAFGIDKDTGNIVQEWGVAQSVLSTHGRHPKRQDTTYVVFDLLAHGGLDIRTLPFRARRDALETIFDTPFAALTLMVQMPATEDSHEALIASGFEGSVVKALDAPYASGKRGKGWWKIKPQATIDAIVTGYKPGEGGFKGLIGAIEFAQHDADGNLIHRGRCSGMDFRTRVWMTENIDRLVAEQAVIEVKHMGTMPATDGYPCGSLRHPQYKRRRTDKTPAEVTLHDS